MCGICGAIGFDNPISLVRSMSRAMVHRGPDSGGFVEKGRLAFGIRRLRIIDLNTGDQPIYNEDRNIAVVLNGEIYNFKALREELSKLGHCFTTNSDTEVVVHAYEEWGKDCLKRLQGMFAFAIFDRRKPDDSSKVVLLARDRLGIKPLYVWQDRRRLLFASEVRAILASGACTKRLSAAGIYTYLSLGSVQEPLTVIDGIKSMAPASWLQIEMDLDDLKVTSGTYWQPPPMGKQDPAEDGDLLDWLTEAVRSHLISDVPLGSFLSGGLDSGAIVALSSAIQKGQTHTFTLAFDNWPHDERNLAKLTARYCRTKHHTRVISEAEVLADLPKAIAAMDQPTVDGINTWYVSREARRAGLRVALSGVGGDELFAGYPSFRKIPRLQYIRWIANCLPRNLTLQTARFFTQPDAHRKLTELLHGQTLFDHPYFTIRSLFPSSELTKIFQADVNEMLCSDCHQLTGWQAAVKSEMDMASRYDLIGEISWLELSQYMRSTLLRDTDTMSMAHSLEVRVPFVDHLLIGRVLPMKGKRKLKGHQSKPLLMESVEKMLPTEVTRSRKQTFTFPFEQWMNRELSLPVSQGLRDLADGLSDIINPASLDQIWRDFRNGQTNWARPWALYVLNAWVECNT